MFCTMDGLQKIFIVLESRLGQAKKMYKILTNHAMPPSFDLYYIIKLVHFAPVMNINALA